MNSPLHHLAALLFGIILCGALPHGASGSPEDDGWIPFAKRAEIRPDFAILPEGGPDGKATLTISSDERPGLDGGWSRRYPVEGGAWYRLTVHRKGEVALERRNTSVELMFSDGQGKRVLDKRVGLDSRPYYPPDHETSPDGWTRISDLYLAPDDATHANIELRLRWAPNSHVAFGGISFVKTDPPQPRLARLAAVHYQPKGGNTPMDNCRQYAPFIEEAAAQNADLVVLGESITMVSNGHTFESAAEPIPGPSTEYFGKLSRKHDLYIVVGLYEREGHIIYNTAALLGPDGSLVGKYRKVCPARDEYRSGVTPGSEYPVFDTRFGKLGIMVCYDVHMPEVARNIAANGAEVIAMPIWGGDPTLARARAIENQIHLVTSTYTKTDDWMKTGIWDQEGILQATTQELGTIVIHEVDLNKRHIRQSNIGDFRSRIARERPPNPTER